MGWIEKKKDTSTTMEQAIRTAPGFQVSSKKDGGQRRNEWLFKMRKMLESEKGSKSREVEAAENLKGNTKDYVLNSNFAYNLQRKVTQFTMKADT